MLHKHQCGDCRHIFEHEVPDTEGMSTAAATKFYDDGHNCPKCHTGPWKDRYFANEKEEEDFGREMLKEEGAPDDVIDFLLALRALSRLP